MAVLFTDEGREQVPERFSDTSRSIGLTISAYHANEISLIETVDRVYQLKRGWFKFSVGDSFAYAIFGQIERQIPEFEAPKQSKHVIDIAITIAF